MYVYSQMPINDRKFKLCAWCFGLWNFIMRVVCYAQLMFWKNYLRLISARALRFLVYP